METIYQRIRTRARQIVSRFPTPSFYSENTDTIALSNQLLHQNQDLIRLRDIVSEHLEDDFGHGMKHALKVSRDAGSLILLEGKRLSLTDDIISRKVLLVQFAGLLHDIRRKKKEHARKGATVARELLQDFPLDEHEVSEICVAIRNHEAFKKEIAVESIQGKLISDCLYDADKFRWGPDNFTDTLWEMVSFFNPPLETFIDHFPKGMQGLERIKTTFRSSTGRYYGPQFIEIGIAIGNALYQDIQDNFLSK